MFKNQLLASIVAVSTFAFANVGAAVDITNTLVNPGFETGGATLSNDIAGWDEPSANIPGRADHTTFANGYGADPGFVPGDWFAYYDQAFLPTVYKWGGVSSATYSVNTIYTFSAFGTQNATHALSIGYKDGIGNYVSLADSTPTVTVDGYWTDLDDAAYTTGNSGAEIGRNIVVYFGTPNTATSASLWVDNATLDATALPVPEPATAALTLLGLIWLAFRRNRTR